MKRNSYFNIESTIKLTFPNSKLAKFAYNSYFPELNSNKTKRSAINLSLKEESLYFDIRSNDITSFRAAVNEIINLGKIVDETIEICNIF